MNNEQINAISHITNVICNIAETQANIIYAEINELPKMVSVGKEVLEHQKKQLKEKFTNLITNTQ